MRQNIVLIVYESVQPGSVSVLDNEHFMLRVFVGATQRKLLPRIVRLIQPLGKRADYVEISGLGKNALDFHIAFYIGELAGQVPGAFFHIISKDTGFDPLIAHL